MFNEIKSKNLNQLYGDIRCEFDCNFKLKKLKI
jgi:hypothetical protein